MPKMEKAIKNLKIRKADTKKKPAGPTVEIDKGEFNKLQVMLAELSEDLKATYNRMSALLETLFKEQAITPGSLFMTETTLHCNIVGSYRQIEIPMGSSLLYLGLETRPNEKNELVTHYRWLINEKTYEINPREMISGISASIIKKMNDQ